MQTDTNKGAELFTAVLAGDVERLRRLLPPCGDRAEDDAFTTPSGVTLLMAAAGSGREAVVELLLGRGADPSRRDARGRTASFYLRPRSRPPAPGRAAGYGRGQERDDPVSAGRPGKAEIIASHGCVA